MSTQHLSDEAIAAFADGVLTGHARERAGRHTARCAECAHAIAVQREAVWALRTAPAPALPSSLMDRLRSVPQTTPLRTVPSALAPDGSAMFAAFGTKLTPMATAALAPAKADGHSRVFPVAMTAATVAVAGVLAVSSGARASGDHPAPVRPGTVHVVPAGFAHVTGGSAGIVRADLSGR